MVDNGSNEAIHTSDGQAHTSSIPSLHFDGKNETFTVVNARASELSCGLGSLALVAFPGLCVCLMDVEAATW